MSDDPLYPQAKIGRGTYCLRDALKRNPTIIGHGNDISKDAINALGAQAARIAALEAERDEARRRRDEWRKKADGYDEVRRALREKVGTPWPPHMSRLLWAGIAADEKKRADDAEAENAKLREARLALDSSCCAASTALGHWMDDNGVTDADLEFAHKRLIRVVQDTRAALAETEVQGE